MDMNKEIADLLEKATESVMRQRNDGQIVGWTQTENLVVKAKLAVKRLREI